MNKRLITKEGETTILVSIWAHMVFVRESVAVKIFTNTCHRSYTGLLISVLQHEAALQTCS